MQYQNCLLHCLSPNCRKFKKFHEATHYATHVAQDGQEDFRLLISHVQSAVSNVYAINLCDI